jgi:hypothetical protein
MANPLNGIILCDYANPALLADLGSMILGDIRSLRNNDLGGLIRSPNVDNFAHVKRHVNALIDRFESMGGSRIKVACFRRASRELASVC